MKVYFERTTQSAIVIWATTTVAILIAAILHTGLRTVGVQESTSLLITLFTLVVLIILGFLFFQTTTLRRKNTKREKTQQFRDQHAELEKRAEERFQFVVSGLGDEKEGTRIGAAILLRTFLHPGYEQFYMQTFDLAVAHLRLPRTPHPPEGPVTALPLTAVSQALIVVFKEAFPLVRDMLKKQDTQFRPQTLDATCIQLDNAYLVGADLKQTWMPDASLREARLSIADLSEANLSRTDFSRANLSRANLSEANLSRTDFSEADLSRANLSRTNLSRTDFSEANLSEANLSEANLEAALTLKDTNLHRVRGLTKEQLEACKAKGAIIDEDPMVSSW